MQVVGYEPDIDGPATLLIAEGSAIDALALEPGRDLAYSLETRRCAGTIRDDGHVDCREPTAPYCDLHTDRWPCARCVGDCDRPLDSCREEHAIYLAAFAPDTFKVGVTRAWRLERRLREQGADRGARLRTVADGRVARQIEAEIAADVGDRVRVPTKIAGFDSEVDEDAWANLLSGYEHEEIYGYDYDLAVSDRPQRETIASGTVRGTKGRILLLGNAGSTCAVDLRDLVGFELHDGVPDRDVQSSLGAF